MVTKICGYRRPFPQPHLSILRVQKYDKSSLTLWMPSLYYRGAIRQPVMTPDVPLYQQKPWLLQCLTWTLSRTMMLRGVSPRLLCQLMCPRYGSEANMCILVFRRQRALWRATNAVMCRGPTTLEFLHSLLGWSCALFQDHPCCNYLTKNFLSFVKSTSFPVIPH